MMEAYGNDAYESATRFSTCEVWLPEDPKECSNTLRGQQALFAVSETVARLAIPL